MRLPVLSWLRDRFRAGPVAYWVGSAVTVFVNGCIRGSLGGAALGGAGGAGTAMTHVGDNLSDGQKFWMPFILMAGAMVANGWKSVVVWHDKNEMPNPWPPPTGLTETPWPTGSIQNRNYHPPQPQPPSE